MKIVGINITKKQLLWCAALIFVFSLVVVGTVSALTTGAWFYDIEASNGNSFSAGSLDLKIDGVDTNVVKFEVENMVPDSGVTKTYVLKNDGTIDGYLDIANIAITSYENGILDPESEAGDVTEDVGELQDRVYFGIFIDNNGDEEYHPSDGDVLIWNGKGFDLLNSNNRIKWSNLNKLMPAGSELNIVVESFWFTASYPPSSQANLDNLAMGDSFTLDITFELGQTEPL